MGEEGEPWGGSMGSTAGGRRLRRLGGLCAFVALVVAAAAAPAPAAVAPNDALDRVLAVAPDHANRSTPGTTSADKHELTLALRDLAAGLAGLAPARRSAAERLFARP